MLFVARWPGVGHRLYDFAAKRRLIPDPHVRREHRTSVENTAKTFRMRRECVLLGIALAVSSRTGIMVAWAAPPMTIAAFESITADATGVARELGQLEATIADAGRRAVDLKRRRESHNARPCTYPPGRPELCADYDREKEELDAEAAALRAEVNGYFARQGELRRRLAGFMAGLRSGTFTSALDRWRSRILACANLRAVSDGAQCLVEVWNAICPGQPPRAQARQTSEFTGTRAYHLTAKSWVDATRITEDTWRGRKFQWFSNTEPMTPLLTGAADFKVYQTFVAEVIFEGGEIARARFLPESLDHRAGATGGIRGDVRLLDQKEDFSCDRRGVSFWRTVEANPSMLVVTPDYFDPVGSTHFRPIFNTLRVTITADGVQPSGTGSAFPSHKFWIGTSLFGVQAQVQPSAYFRP